jgi:hypothetical protein
MLQYILQDKPEDNIPCLFGDSVYNKAFGIYSVYSGRGTAMTARQMAFNHIMSGARVEVKHLYAIITNN